MNTEPTIALDDSTEYCDVIYHGGFHFTARIITAEGQVWYNDGMTTGNSSQYDGNLKIMEAATLRTAHGRKMSVLIYVKV